MSSVDEISESVYVAIVAAGGENRADFTMAMEKVLAYRFDDLLAELFLWIEDFTEGYTPKQIVAAADDPLPEDAEAVVAAVLNHDLVQVSKKLGTREPKDLFLTLLLVAATLRKARASLTGLAD